MIKNITAAAVAAVMVSGAVAVRAQNVPVPEPVLEEAVSAPQPEEMGQVQPAAAPEGEGFVLPREGMDEPEKPAEPKVRFNPRTQRDPTLSPDDFLLLQFREKQRLAALEAERQRKLAEERRKREEEERRRQLELALAKDPTRAVRNKIHIGGIIGQEVFIGSKIYTVGKTIHGARIVEVRPEEVVFSYKGHKFTRKVQLN